MIDQYISFKIRKTILTLVITIFGFGLCRAQELMERVYSPSGDNNLTKIFRASDGGAWITMEWGKVLKVDENYDVEWFEDYNILGLDNLIALEETSDGGTIIGGYEGSWIPQDHVPLLLRISPEGDVIWAKSFDPGYFGRIQSIIKLEDDQFMAVCSSEDAISNFIFFDEGGMEFDFFEPKIGGVNVRTFECQKIGDGRFVVGGDYYDENLDRNVFYLAEFDGQSPLWSKTYTYEKDADSSYLFALTTTANGDIGLGARIALADVFQSQELILFSVNEIGELNWGKKMQPDFEVNNGITNGLVSDGDNGMYHSFLFMNEEEEWVSHFSGWNESGANIFIQTVTKPTNMETFGYEYRTDEGFFVLSGEFLEFATEARLPVLALQGPQGEMPCDQSSESVTINDFLPEVTDVTIELENSEAQSTDLEVSKGTTNVASYFLCTSALSTTDGEAEDWLEIYPNPSDHTVFFEIGNPEARTTLIQIFDQLGREVYSRTALSEGLFSISKESIGSGFFIARISDFATGEVLKQGKFVVE